MVINIIITTVGTNVTKKRKIYILDSEKNQKLKGGIYFDLTAPIENASPAD